MYCFKRLNIYSLGVSKEYEKENKVKAILEELMTEKIIMMGEKDIKPHHLQEEHK